MRVRPWPSPWTCTSVSFSGSHAPGHLSASVFVVDEEHGRLARRGNLDLGDKRHELGDLVRRAGTLHPDSPQRTDNDEVGVVIVDRLD